MPAVRFRVEGLVQGVGFRDFVRREALKAGLSGWVRNLPDGRVEGEAQGSAEVLQLFLRNVQKGPPGSRVTGFHVSDLPESTENYRFTIRP